ncbi:putative multidrug export ATP-binding/permease protein [Fusobacterium sp. DD29]|uniref:ABC transporter ATP-binding protein n=1 Tax=unclassified Fusobacterium TaxID=2648384 RepID=UPI001B8D5C7E|nr:MULTISPECIES: ABC transporter ATP-binding protein [unclassified Fusobacterium]MBR8700942.1 putative multidrug export ATP-binding/permease protein [Fusobacterium sp. DD45]MBR8710722.1 putative multidrug export ATP-binding/permease protein [Fusobacterium sp. DD28]MBR8749325.1 putative multidrug export ATP-binding/permease protein [Fusobacterium sp. DD29]MBR8751284.1 putative multidrug export ATP-binding/permease protein [Fusobacterium sp. DD26]MBR8761577.1 putative multidrug export ATP-bindin
MRYSLRYKWTMLGVIVLSLLTSGASAVPAWLSKYLIDDVLVNRDMRMMVIVVGAIFVATVIKVTAGYYSDITSDFITETINREIKVDVFDHLQKLPISYFRKHKLGDIMARLSGDSAMLGKIGFILFEMLKEGITVIALLFRMFQVDLILALLSLTVMPLVIGTVRKYTRKIRKSGRVRQDTSGQVTAYIQESLSGIFVIKAFNNSNMIIDKFKTITQDEFNKAYRSKKIKAKVSPINELITTLMVILVASYGGYQIIVAQTMSAGDLISFVTALGLMSQPLKRLIAKNNDLQESVPSADRVLEILDIPMENDFYGTEAQLENEIHDMKFKNLYFSYNDDENYALKDINLDVKAGEVVAFVGKSGSGKTTIVNLIPRFYEAQKGELLINGKNIKNISLKKYRDRIAVVPQESFLFSGTIAENIAFGKSDVTREEIENAAKMANAFEFINELPEKFETEVGERGTLLSGGQKQRIAIARALIQNPQILILDEATSALDTQSERLVQDALDKLMINRTTFVIAHRLSTIINADKIVVMENGEIKEIGKHQELLDKNGIYRRLYDVQLGKKVNLKIKKEEEFV